MRAHDVPFAPGGKARTAQAAQVGGLQFGDDSVGCGVTRQQALQLRQVGGQRRRQLAGAGLVARHVVGNRLGRGPGQLALPRAGRGRLMALADAGRFFHCHVGAAGKCLARAGEQRFAAGHRAGQAGAHAHGGGGHGGLVIDHLEVVVEARDLIDLDLAQPQALGQRGQVAPAQRALAVVEAVQVLDQQVGARRQLGAQRGHALARGGRDLAALGRAARRPAGLPVQWANGDDPGGVVGGVHRASAGRFMGASRLAP